MSIKASLGCSSVNSTDISDRINIIFKVDSCNICPVFFLSDKSYRGCIYIQESRPR